MLIARRGMTAQAPDKLPDEPKKLLFEPNEKHPHIRNFLDCTRSRQTPPGVCTTTRSGNASFSYALAKRVCRLT